MNVMDKYFSTEDILDGNVNNFFEYTQEEVDDFIQGFDPLYIKSMHESVSRALKFQTKDTSKINNIISILKTLTSKDLDKLDKLVYEFTESNPNMLWNMLHKADKEYYKDPDKFYQWLSNLNNEELDKTIYTVADGKKIHSDDIYISKSGPTKVEILDGYIAISSSNLDALNRFKERVLRSNDVKFEHRIKKHDGITIHSYVFNLNKTND
tara:strand:+ start:127 stop:756 length:630 start_codon:yes stop_codon:yes gene_type:complete